MSADFLFASPTFLSGFARNIDLFGVFDRYNVSLTSEEADALAIYADWSAVGHHLYGAIRLCQPLPAAGETYTPEAEQLQLAIR